MFLKLRQPFSAAPAQATMFKLAHISDPHLGPLPPVRVAELLNKRFFGWLSWVRRRRALHRPEVLAALAADLAGLAPDHLVVTDRKSVVSGKRVSVRFDLGGGR